MFGRIALILLCLSACCPMRPPPDIVSDAEYEVSRIMRMQQVWERAETQRQINITEYYREQIRLISP